MLILTPTEEIRQDEPLIVMAITTTFGDPPPPDHVELPWDNRGHRVTRLRRRSAAIVSWLDEVMPDDVIELGGDVPATPMKLIEQKLDDLPD